MNVFNIFVLEDIFSFYLYLSVMTPFISILEQRQESGKPRILSKIFNSLVFHCIYCFEMIKSEKGSLLDDN